MEQGPTTATGVLHILPSSKDECVRFAKAVVQSVADGQEDALKVYVMLKQFEKASELISDCIKSNVMNLVDLHSEKSFEAFGARVDKAEVGVKYNYEASGDPVWNERKSMVDNAMSLLKERETFLRALIEPMVIVSEETGEVVKVSPPPKVSTSGLKITLV